MAGILLDAFPRSVKLKGIVAAAALGVSLASFASYLKREAIMIEISEGRLHTVKGIVGRFGRYKSFDEFYIDERRLRIEHLDTYCLGEADIVSDGDWVLVKYVAYPTLTGSPTYRRQCILSIDSL